nr:PREDICTED: uncharacterized protein LOC105669830 [Linepithema humile]
MFGKMNILTIAVFFILSHVSCVLSRRVNITQLIKESLRSEQPGRYYELRDIPVIRDMSYLPEEDYNAESVVNELQQLERDNRNLMPEYRNLCETITKRVEITDPDYEYQPPHYYEIFCKSYSSGYNDQTIRSIQKCAQPTFHCVQRSRLLSLVRRRWEGECWEHFTKEIPSGCECMWPVTNLGEITHHY